MNKLTTFLCALLLAATPAMAASSAFFSPVSRPMLPTSFLTLAALQNQGNRAYQPSSKMVLALEACFDSTDTFICGGGGGVGGSGTLNSVAKWTPDGSTLGDSSITDDGSLVTLTLPSSFQDDVFFDFDLADPDTSTTGAVHFGEDDDIWISYDETVFDALAFSTSEDVFSFFATMSPTSGLSNGTVFFQPFDSANSGPIAFNIAPDFLNTFNDVMDGSDSWTVLQISPGDHSNQDHTGADNTFRSVLIDGISSPDADVEYTALQIVSSGYSRFLRFGANDFNVNSSLSTQVGQVQISTGLRRDAQSIKIQMAGGIDVPMDGGDTQSFIRLDTFTDGAHTGVGNRLYGAELQAITTPDPDADKYAFHVASGGWDAGFRLPGVTSGGLAALDDFSLVGCTDCNQDATCTSGGTGAIAFRIAGAWTCQLPGSGGGSVSAADETKMVLEDEFCAPNDTTQRIGALGWTFFSGDVNVIVSESNHPCLIENLSNGSSGDVNAIYWDDTTNTGKIVPTDVASMMYIFRTGSSVADVVYEVGLVDDSDTTPAGLTDGVYFQFDPAASANWRTITVASNTETANSSATAVVVDTFYKVEMVRLSGGNWEFYLDDILLFTHSTNLPTVALIPAFRVQKTTATNKEMDVDYFSMVSKTLTR